MRRLLPLPLALALVVALPRVAAAALDPLPPRDAGLAPADEIRALGAQIAAALDAHGCAVACDALGSMTRAADRLCALDPGPACDDARARVRDAQRRVQAACPECALVGDSTSPPVQAARPDERPAPSPPAAAEVAVSSKRGGCAGCATSGDGGVPDATVLAALGVLVAVARRGSRAGMSAPRPGRRRRPR